MNGNKVIRMVTTAIIALGAAYGSFGHIVHLAEQHGQHGLSAHLYPIMFDALMILSSVNLSGGALNRMTRFWSRVGMMWGLICSLGANLMSSDMTDTLAAIIAVAPAITLLITVEMLLHGAKSVRAGRRRKASAPANVTTLRKTA